MAFVPILFNIDTTILHKGVSWASRVLFGITPRLTPTLNNYSIGETVDTCAETSSHT